MIALEQHRGHNALRRRRGAVNALELRGVRHDVHVAVRVAGEIHDGGAEQRRQREVVGVNVGRVQQGGGHDGVHARQRLVRKQVSV
ncbi:hypothetical protein FGB62_186g017 [Gracilaria domingensis]|nr:hypothetical protein FGB62_186g017 [Gracilaria domingensis]